MVNTMKTDVRRVVAEAVRSGKIVFLKSGVPILEQTEIDASIREHVQGALETLARLGLLVA